MFILSLFHIYTYFVILICKSFVNVQVIFMSIRDTDDIFQGKNGYLSGKEWVIRGMGT